MLMWPFTRNTVGNNSPRDTTFKETLSANYYPISYPINYSISYLTSYVINICVIHIHRISGLIPDKSSHHGVSLQFIDGSHHRNININSRVAQWPSPGHSHHDPYRDEQRPPPNRHRAQHQSYDPDVLVQPA